MKSTKILNRLIPFFIFSSLIFVTSCLKDQDKVINSDNSNEKSNFVPNQLLVKFKAGMESRSKTTSTALALIQGDVVEVISTAAMKFADAKKGLHSGSLMLVNSKLSTLEAIARLKDLPEIEFAEPNYTYKLASISNDPYYIDGSLWGMYGPATTPSNQYGSHAGEVWGDGHTGSSTVWIGIIDGGSMYSHEDLAANFGKNPGEIPNNARDDDGNGYKDDVYGWDFSANDATTFDGVYDRHGTLMAGIIGAAGGNNKGVVGVVWNVKLMNTKIYAGSLTTANAIKAVDYFTDLKQRHGINLVATNNSWGGVGYSQGLYEAIERANQANILFIAAAGNYTNDNDISPFYPASFSNSNIISVASISNTGDLSSFSSFGSTTVDLAAPGAVIFSTVPKYGPKVKGKFTIVSGYESDSGTSCSAAYVTGAVALYASSRPGATAADIKNAILNNAIPTPSLSGKCVSGGRLNVGEF